MSIAQKCPYENENCKYEIFAGEPIFKKCKFCSRNSGNKGKQIEGVTMFEKGAEEYANNWKINKNNDLNFAELAELRAVIYKANKDGAEYGYNKANEWHKPSKKLPEECSLVLAYAFDDTEPSLYKFVTNDQWEWMPRRFAFLSNDQIRLWKEIVPPKEIKEK